MKRFPLPTTHESVRTCLTLLLLLGTLVFAGAQTYTGNVTFNNQASLDAWPDTYTQINGSVTIQGATITDLTPLANITSISGFVKILSNTNLTNLDGLDAVTTIGNTLELTGNPVLNDVNGLHQVGSLGFSLVVTNNASLTHLDGLYSLTTIQEKITITNNAALQNLDGLSQITSVGASIIVQNNPSLTDCCGLHALINSPGVSSTFSNNDTGCDSKPQINTYCGDGDGDGVNLTDGDCDDTNSNIYPGAPEICDGQDNDCDNDVDEGLSIVNSDLNLLSQADVNAAACVESVYGKLRIAGNDIVDLTPLSGLNHVSGNFYITNNPVLASLDGLEQLTYLGVGIYIEYNDLLSDVSALQLPSIVHGALIIRSNPLLTNLDFAQNVTSVGAYVGGNLLVSACNSLTDINGLSNVVQVGTPPHIGRFILTSNPLLSECCAVHTLINTPGAVGEQITIVGNNTTCETQAAIDTYCGDQDTDGVSVQEGDCDDADPDNFPGNSEICDGQDNDCDGLVDEALDTYYGNMTLTSQAAVDAFPACITTFNGVLTINGPGITDLSPLSGLTFVSVLNVYNSPGLGSLYGLHQITAADNLEISGTQLTSLAGLESLNYISNRGTVSENNALINLNGLTGLQTVESRVELINNPALTDISGIQNLTSTNNILVVGNSSLSDCCVLQDLYNAGAVGFLSIYNNNTGCDSQTEITTYCMDADGDGYTLVDGDCHDTDPNVHPGAIEICDGQDNDCDGATDDEDPDVTGQTTWYADADHDGAGDALTTLISCSQPEGYVTNAEDLCPNDGNKTQPGICGCDLADTDADGDGVADCDDTCQANPDINNFDDANCHCEPGLYPVTLLVGNILVIVDCQPCPAGTYCPDGINIFPCPIGTYSGTTGAEICLACEVCTTTQGVGSTSCTPETTPPMAVCQDITVALDNNGQATITGAMIDNGSTDACGIASLMSSPDEFSCSDIGSQPVMLTVTDQNGNTSTCMSTVTVVDPVYPVFISCPSDIGAGLCGDVVTWAEPIASDNCPDVIVLQTGGPSNGSVFDEGETIVTYQVTDIGGNVSSCSFTVTVNSLLVSGGADLIAYFGYPNSVDLSATATGGTAPYAYTWSPAEDLNDPSSPNPMFTPSNYGTFVFTVLVTDANGCTGSATQTVVVEDVRCINNGNQTRIMICHDGETICVNENAVAAHLAHGDYLGSCVVAHNQVMHDSELSNPETVYPGIHPDQHVNTPSSVEAYISPNPFTDHVDIQVKLAAGQPETSIRVYNMYGMLVNELYQGELAEGQHTYHWNGTNTHGDDLPAGIYLIVVQSDADRMTKQVVRMN